jgi:hypothetical protein
MVQHKAARQDQPGHVYTQNELAFSHGWPSIDVPTNKFYRDVLPFNVGSLSTHVQRQLQGNGMHLVSVFAWTTFVLSHVLRRHVVREYCPDLVCLGNLGNADPNRNAAEQHAGDALPRQSD